MYFWDNVKKKISYFIHRSNLEKVKRITETIRIIYGVCVSIGILVYIIYTYIYVCVCVH